MTLPTSEKTTDASTVADASAPDASSIRREGLGGALKFFVSAGAVLLLIPIALYFWFIHQYGVNAIYYDQWNDVALLTHTRYFSESYSGHTTLGMLWNQHNESRTFFPNILVLAQGTLTHLNIQTELYFSGVLLVIALGLIILAHRQDVAPIHLIFYLPVAFLMLSFGQSENTFFGYQMSWYLAITALAAAVFLLNLRRVGWLVLVAAVAMAIVGSYSALQGLLIWPAGLVILLWKHRRWGFVLTWLISAIATTVLYFYHFSFAAAAGGSHSYVLSHPFAAAEFFFFQIGDVLGKPLPPGASDADIVAIGVAVFFLAVVCLAIYVRRCALSKSPIGPALICFGVLFAIWVTVGRTYLGLSAASQSRYATQNLLILAGCYLCLLERWPGRDQESVAVSFAPAINAIQNAHPILPTIREAWRQGLLVALRGLAILLIVIEVWGGIENGIPAGALGVKVHSYDDLVAAHAACAPDALIQSALFPNSYYAYANIRALAVAAQRDHLSFFGTSEGSRLEHTSLPHSSVLPRTSVVKPTSGALLRGGVYLVAKASAICSIKGVNFRITGPGGQVYEVLHANQYLFGFVGGWTTTDVPNGLYTVQSTARDASGDTGTSRPIPVTVQN